jgi:uncharacterized membrane protein SirB2
MLSLEVYKVIHILGLSLVVLSLGGILGHVANGGTKASNALRKLTAISHGVGLLLLLISGFGMLAIYKIHSFPTWVVGKLLVWILLGAFVAIVYKRQALAKKLWFAVPLLVLVATVLAIFKA